MEKVALKNKTGYYRKLPTHIELLNDRLQHMGNVNSWKELELFGKKHGYYFKGAV